jgi:hypothetical protein
LLVTPAFASRTKILLEASAIDLFVANNVTDVIKGEV